MIIRHARRRAEPVRAILDYGLGTRLPQVDRGRPATHPWSCGNQPAYHSMINRRSVPALHRACLHQQNKPEVKAPDVNLRPSLLKTDMTAGVASEAGCGIGAWLDDGGGGRAPRAR